MTTEIQLLQIRKQQARKSKIQLNIWCWAFMLPAVVLYALFTGWPILLSFYYSLLDWSGMIGQSKFIGLANFKEALSDPLFWGAFKNSFKFMIMVVPLLLSVSLILAYVLNNTALKGHTLFRTLFFLPVITTASIVGIIMVFIWGSQGPINFVLTVLKIINKPIGWLSDKNIALVTIVIISIWKDAGTYMIYWLAGLQSVPKDVYEAAEIDGANSITIFFSIVFPLLLPIAGVITLLCIISSLKVFDIIQTMTNGGPFFATDVISTYIYRTAFTSEIGMPRLGYASSCAVLFGAVIVGIGVISSSLRTTLEKKKQI